MTDRTPGALFRFVQVELPWRPGPPDGRYLIRDGGDPGAPASHVLVIATLGAPERRRLHDRRRPRSAEPEPDPTPVLTGRATVIDVEAPFADEALAGAWLRSAGEDDVAGAIAVLNRALHAFRIAAADPRQHGIDRRHAIAARIGFGAGEQVADGLWTSARELGPPAPRRGRARVLAPQARFAGLLGAREPTLACEELALRARLDVEEGRRREAALQLLVALDATLAELSLDPGTAILTDRLSELRARREPVAEAAQTALGGPLGDPAWETVRSTLSRIEAALRARSAAHH